MKFAKKALALGLLLTAVKVVAAPGDTVQGGSGTVEFNGTLTAATCEMTVATMAHQFALSFADAKQSGGTVVKTMTSPITFKDCAAQNLKLKLESTKGTHSGGIAKFEEPRSKETPPIEFFGLVSKGLNYKGLTMTNQIGAEYTGTFGIHVNGDQFGVNITDNTASMDFLFEIISRGGVSNVVAGPMTGGITYTFTYA